MGSSGAIENQDPVIILFDGVCNLCNGLVQFILKRDPAAKFKFASLQSDFGRSQLVRFNMNPDLLHSIVVIEEGHAFERSSAVLRIARHLGGPWKIFMIFKIIPKGVRDALYNLIASNRYSIFGKTRHCMIPSPNVKEHFIE
jgi:predicted DCC family thiol-disulfide oxidoreductase YuxK